MPPEDLDGIDTALPTYKDVQEAAEALKGHANETPVMQSRTLNDYLSVKAFIKCENFQRVGAFKFRGGFNAVRSLSLEERSKGVVAYSSGNHAQGIALGAHLLSVPATIVMPTDAPKLKMTATKGYGATVVTYDRNTEDREAIGSDISSRTGATLIPPYNHKHVIAGQGTVAKELFEQVAALGEEELDFLVVCVGGGGLISGCSLVAEIVSPACKVIGVEPEAGDDAKQSLEQGKIVHIPTPLTIADGAQTQHLGSLTFAVMQRLVHKVITVTDSELVSGMQFFGERMKMVVEPTGCLGLAGLRKLVKNGEIPPGSRCGVIVSGGNVDIARYCHLLSNMEYTPFLSTEI